MSKPDRDDLEEILARTKKQTSISTTGPMRQILILALNTFEDATSAGEAFRRALANWGYNQKSDSKRGALGRIEENVAKLLEINHELRNQVVALQSEIAELRRENAELRGDGLR